MVCRTTTASPGSREDFQELCDHGCVPQVLAALLAAFRNSASFERVWSGLVGDPGKRWKTTRALNRAVESIEGIFRDTSSLEDEKIVLAFENWLPTRRRGKTTT